MELACVLICEAGFTSAGDAAAAEPLDERWEGVLRGLEAIGAAVESQRAGEAFFAVDGLRGIHGGDTAGVIAAAREAAAMSVRIGVAPTRFAALAAASRDLPPSASARALLSSLPVAALRPRLVLAEGGRRPLSARQAENLVESMSRLGIETLGALAALPAARVADRFGQPGLRARRLARGEDEPLRPRRPHEEVVAEIELPEGTAGQRLERALELLIDRLLASRRRRGRTLLGLRLSALLSDGGSWSVFQGLGRPTASPAPLRAVLTPRLTALPTPAVSLRLRAVGLGPPASEQLELTRRGDESRRRRLGEAVREVRAAQGAEALLKVLPIDDASRVPERRAMLTPFPEP